MKKKFKTFVSAALALMLSGCFKTRIQIDVTKEGTASGSMSLLMSQTLLGMNGTSIEDALEEMKANYQEQYPDAKIEPIQEGEGESAFAGIRIDAIPVEDYSVKKEGNKITLTVPLGQVQDEIADESGTAEDGTDLSVLKNYGGEATLTVNMPGKAEANYGTVNENTVVVDLLAQKAAEPLVVTCTLGMNPLLIAGILAGAAAVLGLIAFLVTRKKSA